MHAQMDRLSGPKSFIELFCSRIRYTTASALAMRRTKQMIQVIHGDQARPHSSSSYRRVYVLWFQLPNAIPTPRQVVFNMHGVMLRVSFDIVDQIELERFEPAASLDPRSVDFAHLSLPITHSRGSSNVSEVDTQDHQPSLGVEVMGYDLLKLALGPGIRNLEGGIVLPRTDSRPNDAGVGFGDTPSSRVSFHLAIGVGIKRFPKKKKKECVVYPLL